MSTGWTFAVGAALTWGAASFLAGQACRRGSTLSVLVGTQLAGLLTMALVTGVQLRTTGVDWAVWGQLLPWAAVAGLAELIGFAALYRAMAAGPMGIAAPVAGLGVVVPVVAGLFGGAALAHWQVLGLIIAGAGIALLAADRSTTGTGNLLLAAASGMAFGVALVALAQGAQLDEVGSGTVMRCTTVPPLIAVWWWQRGRSYGRHDIRKLLLLRTAAPAGTRWPDVVPWLGLITVAGVADAVGNLAFALASTRTSLTVAALVGSLDPVVTALLARVCLAERIHPAGRWGSAAAVIGAALVSAS